MRRAGTALLLSSAPLAAHAEGTMPQMDFSNPLTLMQVGWMVVILVVLYLVLSRWGLPEVGKVLEHRASMIAKDLAAARAAKQEADQTVTRLNATIAQARNNAQAEVAKAVTAAKAEAVKKAAALAAQLEAKLAESEKQIEAARTAGLAAIRPVAEETVATILVKLTGTAPAADALARKLDEALASRKAA